MTTKAKRYHLVYPHQLFLELLSFPTNTAFLMIEDPLFFGDKTYPQSFHKQKIVLHRASMKAFADRLQKKGFFVAYFDYSDYPDPAHIADYIKKNKGAEISWYDPVDNILGKRLHKAFVQFQRVSILESPNFLTETSVFKAFFKGKERWLMNSFYIFQRKRLSILLDVNQKPIGGKWSFDTENRKRLPKNVVIPAVLTFKPSIYVEEAIEYTNHHFRTNPGDAKDFNYPITHLDAKKALHDFLQNRISLFGCYEDAIAKKESVLFHSTLSASLNTGLLSPKEVVDAALLMKDSLPIASLEGFIRQIIGWREFMRAVYVLRGSALRKNNFLGHRHKLPASWYDGTTEIAPLDATINKVLQHAYCHHIERLMILGNFMLLSQIDPDEVYRWFMDMFIDAYDWVMVPNVYAMSQFADGGTITTKPYFSSSNYIIKMSDYQKGEWCQVWDNLFYHFLTTHRAVIAANPRLRVLLSNLDRRNAK